ncbi:MAG: hypothetical protein J7647_01440 [Cyanobacteria bacterium SBLK]|nr:hypothetical protein [Cyanobacteria bacterium SBLK]
MLAKIWQWLKRLWHRWFSGETPRPQQTTLAPPKREDAEYERIFWDCWKR